MTHFVGFLRAGATSTETSHRKVGLGRVSVGIEWSIVEYRVWMTEPEQREVGNKEKKGRIV